MGVQILDEALGQSIQRLAAALDPQQFRHRIRIVRVIGDNIDGADWGVAETSGRPL